ncbi:PREDICTED: lysozyme-like protein 6 isoform X2 [Chinchilla lanigera]|uniref:lysozyme-like protein 6 isoform X2 n=1 Tax=Chinchilla lanigera TaxID=34839 RepID=UPI00069792F6|nr:PREDICTED: lysozyme-like protein 6 isoform X2 [Chinchilla lanigera]
MDCLPGFWLTACGEGILLCRSKALQEDQQKPVRPEQWALLGTLSPLRMARVWLISLASCLLVVNQAFIIKRCDLAKILHEEQLDGFEGYSLSDWLCLAFVESNFNISKVNENADGSFDYGIFQINSHYWCNDYQSHSENYCHMDCQGLARAPGWERCAEAQPSRLHQLR